MRRVMATRALLAVFLWRALGGFAEVLALGRGVFGALAEAIVIAAAIVWAATEAWACRAVILIASASEVTRTLSAIVEALLPVCSEAAWTGIAVVEAALIVVAIEAVGARITATSET